MGDPRKRKAGLAEGGRACPPSLRVMIKRSSTLLKVFAPQKRQRTAAGTSAAAPPAADNVAAPAAAEADDDETAAARAWFASHDRDGNGVLDVSEYRELLLSLGTAAEKLHPKYVDHFLTATDTDHDGVVTLDEFLRVHKALREFDRHLRAPRRPPRETADLGAASRLAKRAELTCPPLQTREVEAGGAPFVVESRYADLDPIGEGAYGCICAAVDERDGAEVAIKRVRPAADALQLRCCLRELAILRHFGRHSHAQLLGLRAIIPPPGGHLADWRELYLVSPLYDTDLHQLIKTDTDITDGHCAYFIWQLLRGLHALHSAGVIHRDIKPSNLLINANCDLVIADFGISRPSGPPAAAAPADTAAAAATDDDDDDDGPLFTSYAVTRWYRPPELLCGNKRYGTAVDMWSAGCVLAELLGRAPAFAGPDHMAMLRSIVAQLGPPSDDALAGIQDARAVRFLQRISADAEPTEWADTLPDASAGALALLSRLLRWDPSERPAAPAALGDEWLAPHHSPADLADAEASPRVKFDFEGVTPNLDHFLLAALDAVRDERPDYPLKLSGMLRFGIMHDRTVPDVRAGAESTEEDALLFPDDD